MANDRLRTALLQRGLTPTELADAAGVDPKTVERWIGGRIPYRRHRYLVATRLQADETYLWPDALAPSEAADASESEILTVYPHRWAVPRDAWGHLFDSAEKEIGVLVYSGLFLAEDTGLHALLARKAAEGVSVRFLLGDPESPACGHPWAGRGHRRGDGCEDPQRDRAVPLAAKDRGRAVPGALHRAVQLDLPGR